MRSIFNKSDQSATYLMVGLAVIAASTVIPELAMAGTGGAEFSTAETRITDIIGGTGGKLVAALSLGFAAIASIMKFNPVAVGSALGVGLLASTGVAAVQTGITAII